MTGWATVETVVEVGVGVDVLPELEEEEFDVVPELEEDEEPEEEELEDPDPAFVVFDEPEADVPPEPEPLDAGGVCTGAGV